MTKAKLIIYDSLPLMPTLKTDNAYVKNKIDSIKNTDRRNLSILAYNLLNEMLYEHTSTTLNDCNINENAHGKPYFTNSGIHFNISHSYNAVMCAVSDSQTGVDVERIGEIKPLILKKCFSADEAALISSNTDFYMLWTLKESYVKALGEGISKRLYEVNFKLDKSIFCVDNGISADRRFYSSEAYGYAFSICSADQSIDFEVKKV